MNKSKETTVKFLSDYLPLIIFFAAFKFPQIFPNPLARIIANPTPIIIATIYMVLATLAALVVSYILLKKIPFIALFSAVVLTIFGGLTVFFNDESFIKIKPTIINSIFALVLFYGYFSKKPLLSYLFENKIKLAQKDWLTLSLRWACFFIFLALLNELIWRNFSTEFWVKFKVFGMMPLTMIFTVFQIPFLLKNTQK